MHVRLQREGDAPLAAFLDRFFDRYRDRIEPYPWFTIGYDAGACEVTSEAYSGTGVKRPIRQLFTPAEVERVSRAFEWSIQNCGGGQGHDGSKRTMFAGPIEHAPDLCALMDHPGILGLIGGVIGEDFNYCGGDGNYYTVDTGWHPDGNWGQLWATKTAFYLDEVKRDSGCLRVIPGSHHARHGRRKAPGPFATAGGSARRTLPPPGALGRGTRAFSG